MRKSSKPKTRLSIRNVLLSTAGICALVVIGIIVGIIPNPLKQNASKPFQNQNTSVGQIPSQVNNFLTNQDFQQLEHAGMTIYRGNNPPNIEGSYLLDTLTVTSLNGPSKTRGIGTKLTPYNFIFANQTNNGNIDVDYRATGSQGSGRNAYISGENGCFTVYADQSGSYRNCGYKSPQIFSGCLGGQGLTNIEFAFYLKEKTNASDCRSMEDEGHVAIYEESDGIGEVR